MNVSKTTPLNEQQLIDLLAQKFSCASSVEVLKEAIQSHEHSPDESRKLSAPDPKEMALIMQSAQGLYFGAFTKWLSHRFQNDDLDAHLTDADIQAGIYRDTLVNPYIGMIPTTPKMRALNCEDEFLTAKTKTLEFMVSCHAAFQRQIQERTILLTPGEDVANAIISHDYDKSPNGRLSKSYKKMSNWLLNFDEACNIFISTFTAVLIKHHEATGRDITVDEARVAGDQLYKFLNGAAHLPRYKGMTLVHQVDFCNSGIDLSYVQGKLDKVTLSGSISGASLEQLNDDPLTKTFLASAKENLLSTGCPAIHISHRHDSHSLNLLQISMRVFLQNLERAMFPSYLPQPSGVSIPRICMRPKSEAKPS